MVASCILIISFFPRRQRSRREEKTEDAENVLKDTKVTRSSEDSTGGDASSFYGVGAAVLGKDSTWTVTGDSVLTNLYNAGTIADDAGRTVTVQTADGTVLVEGTSGYTITVKNYSDSADLSGASAATSFSDYAVEKPEALK